MTLIVNMTSIKDLVSSTTLTFQLYMTYLIFFSKAMFKAQTDKDTMVI